MIDVRPDLQAAWLGQMQQELGVNASNLILKDIVIADLQKRVDLDAETITALRKRALEAEENVRGLQAMIRPERASKRGRRLGKNTD